MSREIGIPDAILVKARTMGVHNDCMVAGPSGACEECTKILMGLMHQAYGHLPTGKDVLKAVARDLLAEPREPG